MSTLVKSLCNALFKKLLKRPSPKTTAVIDNLGKVYNLQEIYHRLNADYFEKKLDLAITWFGSEDRAAKRRRLLGSYNQKKQLIKIHRLLDNTRFPEYFVSYVVYHEMLHHVCPPKRWGKRRIHHEDFKVRERKFQDFALAKRWAQDNRKEFFSHR